MKINKEQYDVLVAKLDWIDNVVCVGMKNGREPLERIEQGLDKLLQSHAALEKEVLHQFEVLPSQVFAEFQKRVVPSDARPAKKPASKRNNGPGSREA